MLNPSNAFWSFAFRPGFLGAALFSCISLLIWAAFLTGHLTNFSPAMNPITWHIHEMIFGFVGLVAMGFVLTAIQNWTKLRSMNGIALQAFVTFWLIARISFATSFSLSLAIAWICDMIWMMLGILYIIKLLRASGNKNNWIFVYLFGAAMLVNSAMVLADHLQRPDIAIELARIAVVIFALVVGVVGGRVIPFFTRNRFKGKITILPTPKLDKSITVVSVITILIQLLQLQQSTPILMACAYLVLAGYHFLRYSKWFHKLIFQEPLLWSLHGTYVLLGLGFLALALAQLNSLITVGAAIHIITVGTFGGMILSMMARVSLGHTGRPLKASKPIVGAFILMFLSVLTRVILEMCSLPLEAWVASVACWVAAYLLFLIKYTPILLRPRAN